MSNILSFDGFIYKRLFPSGRRRFFLLYILSFILVAFGQPAWINNLSIAAACLGIGIHFKALSDLKSAKAQKIYAFLWFFAVEAIHLSWMGATKYHGPYILAVYIGVLIGLAIQWVILCWFIFSSPKFGILKALATASLWVLLEWQRLYFLCGFAFDPIGLAMTWHPIPMQLLSLWGIYGLSFWVMLCNGAFYLWLLAIKNKNRMILWICLTAFPYLFGVGHFAYHKQIKQKSNQAPYTVALVQTGLKVEEKIELDIDLEAFLSPYDQWGNVLESLIQAGALKTPINLIVLPEAAVPYGTRYMVYDGESVKNLFKYYLGSEIEDYFPPSTFPYGSQDIQDRFLVSNAYFAQTLANYFGAECVVGFDDAEVDAHINYNAAFSFYPASMPKVLDRYEKRVLVPLAEYLPFSWLSPLVAKYGIECFATHGKSAKIQGNQKPYSVSICYDECFGHLIREGKLKGAELFVNITNDGWYYPSKLPIQHFLLGRLRAIENGVPVVRCCNTGITSCINSLGEVEAKIGEDVDFEYIQSTLIHTIDTYCYNTIYTMVGDYLIILATAGYLGIYAFLVRSKLKAHRLLIKA